MSNTPLGNPNALMAQHTQARQRVIEQWAEEHPLIAQFAGSGQARAALLELERAVGLSDTDWANIFNVALQLRAAREVSPEERARARYH